MQGRISRLRNSHAPDHGVCRGSASVISACMSPLTRSRGESFPDNLPSSPDCDLLKATDSMFLLCCPIFWTKGGFSVHYFWVNEFFLASVRGGIESSQEAGIRPPG